MEFQILAADIVPREKLGWIQIPKLDSKFQREDRKITPFVYNFPTHPDVNDLKAIELVFLPPNTTSHKQPMDQSVIW